MPGNTSHEPCISIVYLAPDLIFAKLETVQFISLFLTCSFFMLVALFGGSDARSQAAIGIERRIYQPQLLEECGRKLNQRLAVDIFENCLQKEKVEVAINDGRLSI